ncbi:MAG: AAA family ATPase [Lachnospiraceae bacterium]|nr:AAA family ATPase [Lachnospiraceae bacterium]
MRIDNYEKTLLVTAAAVSFICDELSEQEKQYQRNMQEEYNAYKNRRNREYNDTLRYYENAVKKSKGDPLQAVIEYQRQRIERRKIENRHIHIDILNLCTRHYDEKENLLKECTDITQISLDKAVYKLQAYLEYLADYKKRIRETFENSGEIEEPFSLTLPKDCDFVPHGTSGGSEKAGDALSAMQFKNIKMVQSADEKREFQTYLKENDLLDNADEWIIAPIWDEGKKSVLKGVIMQSGNQYAYKAMFENLESNAAGRLILRYKGILEKKDFVSFDSVFVTSNVTVECYSPEQINNDRAKYSELFEECFKLQLYLTYELLMQKKMAAVSPMGAYLKKSAKKQQTKALKHFKEGRVVNEKVKMAVLNVKEEEYSDNGYRINLFFNGDIQTNETQADAVIRAFGEEKFFMIQGAPGTGKTTVIKELIMQQLNMIPDSKILFVSQTNDALDNVIRGIVETSQGYELIEKNQIVRCGSTGKIPEDIDEYSLENKCKKYKENLKNHEVSGEAMKLREKWQSFIEDKANNDAVGEYLLVDFRIVGATCAGLESRHYGLNGYEFDLVIIDDAGAASAGELLIPINRAKKLIMIGDYKQQADSLNKSFFQRLYDDCPDNMKCTLKTQLRMTSVIAGLFHKAGSHMDNKEFFESVKKVEADKRLCEACGRELDNNENVLCVRCLEKSETVNCQGCNKEIVYPLYYKHILKKEAELICGCSQKAICEECGKSVWIEQSALEELQLLKKKCLCNECTELYKQKVYVTCERCGDMMEFTYAHKRRLEENGNALPTICPKCRQDDSRMVTVGVCKACGKDITYQSYFIARHNIGRQTLHKECRDKLCDPIFCEKCGRKFVITYGEKEDYESRGDEIPRICEKCRG